MERTDSVSSLDSSTDWSNLPQTAIHMIAVNLIRETGSFLEVQHKLSLNKHWYNVVKNPQIETHLKIFLKGSSNGRGTRNDFNPLKKMLTSFPSEDGLINLKCLQFANLNNHMNKVRSPVLIDHNYYSIFRA